MIYNVDITETTVMIYHTTVEAEDANEAEALVREMYENGDLDPDGWEVDMDNGGVEFEVVENEEI